MPRLVAVAPVLLLASSIALAGDLTPQQQKMQDCNASAGTKGLKGDERQKFMSSCLSAKAAENKGASQQDRMKTCNRDAGEKGLKGDERNKFMSACLSAK